MNGSATTGRCGGNAALDRFLGGCLRAALDARPLPGWPAELDHTIDEAVLRIIFHGIAPVLAGHLSSETDWPEPVIREARKAAAMLSFWEASHRQAMDRLISGFASAGIPAVVMKGTALAYSAYPNAAMRRRGDTDILVPAGDRARARAVLQDCGFRRTAARQALQEDWRCAGFGGFVHVVDIHWRLNASARVSRCLESASCFGEWADLPDLAPAAKAMGPVANTILCCINRHSHGTMGYRVGKDRLFDPDRLIWAVDLFLLTHRFDEGTWQYLTEQARLTGTAAMVADGLDFAHRLLGAPVPDEVTRQLQKPPRNDAVTDYFATISGVRRLWSDVIAAGGLREKAKVAVCAVRPDDAFLAERFPDAQGWPKAALHVRRWIEGASKLARGGA